VENSEKRMKANNELSGQPEPAKKEGKHKKALCDGCWSALCTHNYYFCRRKDTQ
jgi:hypothetical protein